MPQAGQVARVLRRVLGLVGACADAVPVQSPPPVQRTDPSMTLTVLGKTEDGSGPFEFASTGRRGTGTGRIGARPFAFTLG